jgi:hydrogenase/urease accessory protein HupE
MDKSSSAACVNPSLPGPRRLSGSEAVVIVIIICLGAVLATVAGMSIPAVLQLLAGAGVVAALVVGMVTGAPQQGLRRALNALLGPLA